MKGHLVSLFSLPIPSNLGFFCPPSLFPLKSVLRDLPPFYYRTDPSMLGRLNVFLSRFDPDECWAAAGFFRESRDSSETFWRSLSFSTAKFSPGLPLSSFLGSCKRHVQDFSLFPSGGQYFSQSVVYSPDWILFLLPVFFCFSAEDSFQRVFFFFCRDMLGFSTLESPLFPPFPFVFSRSHSPKNRSLGCS